MYSMVLMTALVTSTATPNWGHRGCGCSYSAPVGCTYQGGFACTGCYGCGGQVQGYGAAGGCYGYHGGCYGAFGNNYMDPYVLNSNGCYGCYGGHSCYGVPVPGFAPGTPAVKPAPGKDPFPPINPDVNKDPKEEIVNPPKEKEKKPKLEEGGQARAKIRIEVPVGGKLFVDGRHVNVAAGTRIFQTPLLSANEPYFYDIRIEIDDRSEERRVVIRAGQDALVSFPTLRSPGALTAQVR